MTDNKGILVYAQITRNNEVLEVVNELASEAQKLSAKLNGEIVEAVLLTNGQNLDNIKNSLKAFYRVYVLKNEKFSKYSTDIYSKAVIDLIKEIKPSIFLIGATTQGRDLAPRIASELNTGLTADCTKLDINEKLQLAATRPTFGGKLMATILSKNYPQMATVRPNVLKISENVELKNTEFIEVYPNLENIQSRVKLLEFIKSNSDNSNDIEKADILVAGGKGVKDFSMLEELAKLLGAKVAATRGAVDLGLANSSIQVGQTGKTVSPKTYIAIGISGAIQHQVGMENSGKIIAINNDENAPIFDIADVGIVGDLNKIVLELINELRKRG